MFDNGCKFLKAFLAVRDSLYEEIEDDARRRPEGDHRPSLMYEFLETVRQIIVAIDVYVSGKLQKTSKDLKKANSERMRGSFWRKSVTFWMSI